MSIKKLFLISTFFIFTGFYVQDVVAQESSEPRLEEVVVTAQKKEQGLSEVPISIQVLSSERITDMGVSSWEEIAQYVPGLTVAKGVQEQSIYMRGVGSGTNKDLEKIVKPGNFLERGQVCATIIQLDPITFVAEVPESVKT